MPPLATRGQCLPFFHLDPGLLLLYWQRSIPNLPQSYSLYLKSHRKIMGEASSELYGLEDQWWDRVPMRPVRDRSSISRWLYTRFPINYQQYNIAQLYYLQPYFHVCQHSLNTHTHTHKVRSCLCKVTPPGLARALCSTPLLRKYRLALDQTPETGRGNSCNLQEHQRQWK